MRLKRADAVVCSTKCRVRAHRKSLLPTELISCARWVRWKYVRRAGKLTKMPVDLAGSPASSTDPATWCSYAAARKSIMGDGLGFVVNGDGLACADLDGVLVDGVLDPRAARFLASLGAFYIEVSPSGSGIHAWLFGGSPDGRKVFSLEDGLRVEWYSDKRFLTVTGKRFFI